MRNLERSVYSPAALIHDRRPESSQSHPIMDGQSSTRIIGRVAGLPDLVDSELSVLYL